MAKIIFSKILSVLGFLTFAALLFATGLICAFVYDIEPVPPEKRYELERAVFNRTHDCNEWGIDFPTFSEWLDQQEQKENRFQEWLSALGDKIGHEAAAAFDPWYVDTRESQAAAAPDNWVTGERD